MLASCNCSKEDYCKEFGFQEIQTAFLMIPQCLIADLSEHMCNAEGLMKIPGTKKTHA